MHVPPASPQNLKGRDPLAYLVQIPSTLAGDHRVKRQPKRLWKPRSGLIEPTDWSNPRDPSVPLSSWIPVTRMSRKSTPASTPVASRRPAANLPVRLPLPDPALCTLLRAMPAYCNPHHTEFLRSATCYQAAALDKKQSCLARYPLWSSPSRHLLRSALQP